MMGWKLSLHSFLGNLPAGSESHKPHLRSWLLYLKISSLLYIQMRVYWNNFLLTRGISCDILGPSWSISCQSYLDAPLLLPQLFPHPHSLTVRIKQTYTTNILNIPKCSKQQGLDKNIWLLLLRGLCLKPSKGSLPFYWQVYSRDPELRKLSLSRRPEAATSVPIKRKLEGGVVNGQHWFSELLLLKLERIKSNQKELVYMRIFHKEGNYHLISCFTKELSLGFQSMSNHSIWVLRVELLGPGGAKSKAQAS